MAKSTKRSKRIQGLPTAEPRAEAMEQVSGGEEDDLPFPVVREVEPTGKFASHGAGDQSENETVSPAEASGRVIPRTLSAGPNVLETGAYAPAVYKTRPRIDEKSGKAITQIREDR